MEGSLQVFFFRVLAAKHAKVCFRISHAGLLLFVLHVFCGSHWSHVQLLAEYCRSPEPLAQMAEL
jgi:hypothetical protein